MNFKFWPLLLLPFAAQAEKGQITFLQRYNSNAEVRTLSDSLRQPLMIFRGNIFIVSAECLGRDRGDKSNERDRGNASNERDRGNASNERDRGNASNERDRGNASNERDRGNASNERDRGNASNERDRGNASNERDRGNASNERDRGNASNERDRGNASNERDRGNASNERDRGDQSNQIYCEINNKGNIVIHLPGNHSGEKVEMYYGGKFITETENFFIIK